MSNTLPKRPPTPEEVFKEKRPTPAGAYFRERMEVLQKLLSAKYGRKVKIFWSWEGGELDEADWEAWYLNPITGQPSEPVRCISGVHALNKLIEREEGIWPPKPPKGT